MDEKCKVPPVAFSSYPRSGNTFLRKMLEHLSGIFTGADFPADATRDMQ